MLERDARAFHLALVGGAAQLPHQFCALRQAGRALPEDRKLDEFVQGGAQLAQGAQRLLTGVRTIEAALPASITRIQGSLRSSAPRSIPGQEWGRAPGVFGRSP